MPTALLQILARVHLVDENLPALDHYRNFGFPGSRLAKLTHFKVQRKQKDQSLIALSDERD